MATIVASSLVTGTPAAITKVELTGTDDVLVKAGTLYIDNTSASPATINIDGDEAPDALVVRGAGTIDLTAGYDITVAAGEMVAIKIGDISEVFRGVVAVTGGTAGIFAWIIQ